MKKLVLILMIITVLLSGCRKNTDFEQLQNTKPHLDEGSTSEPTVNYSMPSLPDMDFSKMDFFEDGYEVVEYRSLSDGDTATFVVGGMPMSTRFLAIDTPEVNSSTTGMQPWAMAAKEYTKEKLKNAETIILQLDEESDIFDSYNRLLAWVWVDGELLNYKLVEEGLAYVKYLYGDYVYSTIMIKLESSVQKQKIKIWGEDDPNFDYDNETITADIGTIRDQVKGKNVILTGVVTNKIDKNAFVQDETGAIYIYANKYNYSALEKGNKIQLSGKVIEYNGLLEISSIVDKKITVLEEGIDVEPQLITLDMIGEDIEGIYVKLENLTVTKVQTTEGEKGYNVIVSDGESASSIRVDKYLSPYPDPSEFVEGETFDVIGNIGQYMETYYVMISSMDDILK